MSGRDRSAGSASPSGSRPAASARQRGRTVSAAFYTVCGVGIVVALVLGVTTALDVPDLEVRGLVEERRGTGSHVTVTVTNNSDRVRCPVIHVAARDRQVRDLADVRADPVSPAPGRIAPGGSITYEATIDGLSERQYREELDAFQGYVRADPGCR